MNRVALVYQPMVESAQDLVHRCADAFSDRGLDWVFLSSADLESTPVPRGLGLAVTFGGDGTILRAARWLGGAVPIVGVQMGRLGFLAELMPEDLPEALRPYLEHQYWADRRVMIEADIGDDARAGGRETSLLALNDIVVGRGQSLRTVTVDVSMDSQLLHSFRCDGLIVATATGSTAYSFAAGGPVLAPDSSELVVTAICPHISALHSIVVPPDVPLRLQVWTSQPAVVTVDGQVDRPLGNGEAVTVRVSEAATTFARGGTRVDFYRRILAKLG
jgi:NAD+ kinase